MKDLIEEKNKIIGQLREDIINNQYSDKDNVSYVEKSYIEDLKKDNEKVKMSYIIKQYKTENIELQNNASHYRDLYTNVLNNSSITNSRGIKSGNIKTTVFLI